MAILEVRQVGKIYQGKARNVAALDGVNLGIFTGEAVGVLGPHGSGKSTLFRLLASLCLPTAGEIVLNDRPIGQPKSRIGVGFVAENPLFPAGLTASESLSFSARLEGVTDEESDEMVRVQLENVDLTKWADTPVSKFSREMTRRLALASALTGSPHFLVIDEPSDRIDRLIRRPFTQAIIRSKRQGVTILHMAHSLSLLEHTVDRVVCLERGKVTRETLVQDLIEKRLLFEIEADIGENLVELPENLGSVVSVTRKRLIVELNEEIEINGVIDFLRERRIRIHAVSRHDESPDSTWISTRPQTQGVMV